MKISVIVPAYNAERFLERAVNSLFETAYPDLEIIIVDDGSADSTWVVAQRLRATEAKVRVFQHPDGKNHGVSASRNLGLQHCTGELIGFLDADDYVLPHRFVVAVDVMREHREVDAVHELAKMEFEQDSGDEIFWDRDMIFGIRAQTLAPCSFRTLLRGVCWNPGCILSRKEFLDRVGGFPEDFRYAEDFHLWLRMVCLGNVVAGNDSEPVSVYYRHSANTFKGGLERKNDVVRAMIDAYRRVENDAGLRVARRDLTGPICKYISHTLIRARETQRCDFGRQVLGTVVSNRFFPIAFRHSEFRRQMVRVMLGINADSAVNVS